jgi:hypothetical protein
MKRWLAVVGFTLFAHSSSWAVGNLADVTVYDRDEHRQLPVYYKDGKYFVVGRPGNPYQISIRNQAGEDVLAVASVDGVNVVSGETANLNQGGYVLNPYQQTDVKGWRKSMQRIAQFYFTDLPDSYAARTGRPDDVGVIGVALFRRKQEPIAIEPYPNEDERDDYRDGDRRERRYGPSSESSKSAPSAAPRAGAQADRRAAQSHRPESKLGTGHGRDETSHARYVDFERASSTPDEVVAIYYDSYRNLVAQGVIPRSREPHAAMPFPGGFVPDPPHYRW